MNKNQFSKLFGIEYVQGYTAALQDVLNTIDTIQVISALRDGRLNVTDDLADQIGS